MNRPQEEPWQARARGRIRDRRARKRARGQVVTLDAVPLSRLVVVEVEAVQDSGAVPATEWMAVSFPAEPANDFAFIADMHVPGLLLANLPSLIGTPAGRRSFPLLLCCRRLSGRAAVLHASARREQRGGYTTRCRCTSVCAYVKLLVAEGVDRGHGVVS